MKPFEIKVGKILSFQLISLGLRLQFGNPFSKIKNHHNSRYGRIIVSNNLNDVLFNLNNMMNINPEKREEMMEFFRENAYNPLLLFPERLKNRDFLDIK